MNQTNESSEGPAPSTLRSPGKSCIEESEDRLEFHPGHDSIPVRVPAGMEVFADDPKRFQTVQDGHVRVFDLADETDRKLYEKLISTAASYSYVTIAYKAHMAVQPNCPPENTMKVLVEWYEKYKQPRKTGTYRASNRDREFAQHTNNRRID